MQGARRPYTQLTWLFKAGYLKSMKCINRREKNVLVNKKKMKAMKAPVALQG